MKKYIYKIFSIVLSLFLLAGCEDILEEEIYSELDPKGLFNTTSGVEAVLLAGYAEASITGNWGNNVVHFEEWCTDIEWETGGGANRNAVLMIGFTWDASSPSHIITSGWNIMFRAVRNANTILESIEGSTLPESYKSLITAEARFVRAWAYYTLYNWFGPVPIRLSNLEEKEKARATEEEMLTFIETEFSEIISALPAPGEEPQYGRAHKGAAIAYLCKFYLNTKQWQKCADAAQDLIDLNYYELYPEYEDLFKVENENNKEFIWVDGHVTEGPGNEHMNGAFPTGFAKDPRTGFEFGENMRNWARNDRLYDSFYNSFEEGDKRKDLIITEYINNAGDTLSLLDNDNTRSFKFWPDVNADGNAHGNDFPEIRYADILLARAEALNELNGPTQDVLDLINQVRERAGLEDLLLADYSSKEELRDHILAERGWEFYSERKRREDLIRHGKFISSANDRGISNAKPYHVRFPIPQTEMDANTNMVQNEGY